jgi:hypothetical protein
LHEQIQRKSQIVAGALSMMVENLVDIGFMGLEKAGCLRGNGSALRGRVKFRMLLELFLGLLSLTIPLTGLFVYFTLKILWRILKFVHREIKRRWRPPSLLCYNRDMNSLEVLK